MESPRLGKEKLQFHDCKELNKGRVEKRTDVEFHGPVPDVSEQCHQLAEFLKEIRDRVSTEDGDRITDILDEIDEELSENRHTPTPTASHLDVDSRGSRGSAEPSGSEYFEHLETEALDLLDEDLHSKDEARSTGFIGKSSEVQWLRAVVLAQYERTDTEWPGSEPQRRPSFVSGSEQISSFSFWTDSDDVSVNFYVDPYELPQLDFAEHLIQCYMLRVHDSFPILPRNFEEQTRVYFAALRAGSSPRLNHKWQAILNLVFAIGANYSYQYNKDWPTGDANMFQARARAFGLNEASLTAHPDLPQIQGLGLLAFYWSSTGQVSR
ncbi:hypothetical protein G6011_07246 [Alternaria panax]|uniref:Transcription factor domain-containing protein n=1 Tax=Alternaria panax TaxID=48097 RepID=A0AAD4FAK2_9PLEO|nr:hypothetical protein G6011_07246 [Alternaria panax]